jgi:orotidine-5'-phosphate decarboxylase
MLSFAARLQQAVVRCRSPLCVGLDPRRDSLPAPLRPSDRSHASQVASALERFCCEVIDVVHPLAGVVKPQAAFFEQYGPAGFQALASVIRYARQHQLLVILDAKRGDIGSTAEAYADAYLAGEGSAVPADALTVNPYLGGDSLEPFVRRAVDYRTGIFVLVKTSNPRGGMFQDLVADGRPLYRHVAEHVQQLAQATTEPGESYGAVGAVIGATYPDQLHELRSVLSRAWLLIPGFGAQGGTADELRCAFNADGLGAIVNSSRAILQAHERPDLAHMADWQQAVDQATREATDQLRSAMGW